MSDDKIDIKEYLDREADWDQTLPLDASGVPSDHYEPPDQAEPVRPDYITIPNPPPPRRLLSLLTSDERKRFPIASGVIDYFPDAIAAVAHISWLGNEKHNPGEPLHWAIGKSMDQDDCLMRHFIERGATDADGAEHYAQVAWRALAALQLYLEKKYQLDPPRNAR